MSGPIVLSHQGHVAVIRMHVPSKMNALNPDAVESLLDAVSTACRADDVGAIVLTGGEHAFCAGEDLTSVGSLTAEEFGTQVDNFQRLARLLLETDKPTSTRCVRAAPSESGSPAGSAGSAWSAKTRCQR
jgi:enoyl-CoA hydratase/carnithine racemase